MKWFTTVQSTIGSQLNFVPSVFNQLMSLLRPSKPLAIISQDHCDTNESKLLGECPLKTTFPTTVLCSHFALRCRYTRPLYVSPMSYKPRSAVNKLEYKLL